MKARFFTNDREAFFVSRPNRFLIIANDGETELACHCPNPGRLIEFLFPGERLILEKRKSSKESAKTDWTVGGIYYKQGIAPLFPARTNSVAGQIILPAIFPELQEIHSEYSIGASRFDFMGIDAAGKRHLIEVKACSLVEYGIAMFPDAPSDRALRHLEELSALARTGYSSHILFVILHGKSTFFVPALHTDPRFAAGLSRYGSLPNLQEPHIGMSDGKVLIHASLIQCESEGTAVLVNPHIPVDLSHCALAAEDRGNYLMLLEIPEQQAIDVGALGTLKILPGWYVYTGSAQKNLSQRISRHLRKTRKRRHWHIDYLTPYTKTITALPIMSYRNLECDLAHSLAALGGEAMLRFGCSDCRCKSHLFYFTSPPMENRAFVNMLLHYRHIESLRR
ncbi:MAG: DNA/RNA nuclease SfsA [Treponema sp.]|nr:DNA/RNA nuclease SfsA [Treponema sp.]